MGYILRSDNRILPQALLLNGYWPLQLLMYAAVHRATKSPRPLKWWHVRGYLVIGVIAGLACHGLVCH